MASLIRWHVSIAALAAAALLALQVAPSAEARERFVPLARALPWPHVSGLIGYRGRLWFVNSRKYVNHNSADLYSFDPAAGTTRYERHLFSQDAGDPVVHGGLLYWPFEDSRWSPGRGEFMVTNGWDWRWFVLPEGRAFHVHGMAVHDDALYAAPSAWRARLQRSMDGGATWKLLHEYPSPRRRVSRITALESFGGALYAGLTTWYDSTQPKLLRWTGDTFAAAKGWPGGSAVPRLERYRGWLYGANVTGEDENSAVWRTDGTQVERVAALDGLNVRALAAAPDALWAVTVDSNGGEVWRSGDGAAWSRLHRFDGVRPVDVAVHGGRAYVGARGPDGGMLWGSSVRQDAIPAGPIASLPPHAPPPSLDSERALAELDSVFHDPARYRELRRRMLPLARTRDPAVGKALMRRLGRAAPVGEASMFGGAVKVPAAKMARWYLMWAMAHNGHGRVPPVMISAPWTQPPNRAEKYLEPAPGAAWAAAELGQDDRDTLAALIGRLDRTGDPEWLKGDMIGALTALTGQRFGYDIAAWRRWWASRRP